MSISEHYPLKVDLENALLCPRCNTATLNFYFTSIDPEQLTIEFTCRNCPAKLQMVLHKEQGNAAAEWVYHGNDPDEERKPLNLVQFPQRG
jgi:hypothetical protein